MGRVIDLETRGLSISDAGEMDDILDKYENRNYKVCHIITKKEIEEHDYERIESIVLALSENYSNEMNKNKLVLKVDGYMDDSRLLHEIPEVREYIQEMFRLLPVTFYYLIDNQRNVFYMCLVDVVKQKVDTESDNVVVGFTITEQALNLLDTVSSLLGNTAEETLNIKSELEESLGFSEEEPIF